MKDNSIHPLLGQMLQKIAPRIGATVFIEPKWKVVGQITFKSGRKRYFRGSCIDLNTLGASEIAKDKDYSYLFMKQLGYPVVPDSEKFFSNCFGRKIGQPFRNIDAAWRYAQRLGLPVIVKPNSGSQGSNVALVFNRKQFYRAMRAIFRKDRIGLVQRPVSGKDYRLVVLDNRIISAYERIPFSVLGDGTSTILRLLKRKQRDFLSDGRDTQIDTDDPRIAEKLQRQRLSLRSVPAKGARIYLLDNANLSTGGESIDVTGQVHPAFRRIAVKLTKGMGLRLCGVDLMVDGYINQKPGKYWILEINAAPGLDHYAKTGRDQEQIVEKLYLEVLKSLARA